MKTIFLLFLAACLQPISIAAQKNNPYNKVGTDFITTYNIIKKDYDAGKILELNQKTLDYYSEITPVKRKVAVDDAATILKTIKGQTLNDALSSTKFAEQSKQVLIRAVNGTDIAKLVEQVKSSPVSTSEKESVLSILAIIYNGNHGATINPQERHGLFWAILGGIVGGAIFGPPGILAGASVGGALGEATP